MQQLLVWAIPIVWTSVLLTHFLVHDPRLCLRLIRYSVTIYLLLLAGFLGVVLPSGFAVMQPSRVQLTDSASLWFSWFACIVVSFKFWQLLVPASFGPIILHLCYPYELQTIVNLGLARLGWTEAVYDPLSWGLWNVLVPVLGGVLRLIQRFSYNSGWSDHYKLCKADPSASGCPSRGR